MKRRTRRDVAASYLREVRQYAKATKSVAKNGWCSAALTQLLQMQAAAGAYRALRTARGPAYKPVIEGSRGSYTLYRAISRTTADAERVFTDRCVGVQR